MKIISLESENVKRLKAVFIKPDGSLVNITGKNGQGKTSVLDCIEMALDGAKSIPAMPIRKGQEKAHIRIDLGDMIVTRKFTKKGSSVTVDNKDGARFQSPQQILTALIGKLSFDPLAFTRQKPAEQFETLRQLANLGTEIDDLDKANTTDYDKRTDFNRKAKEQNAAAAAISVPADLPETAVDETELLQRMQDAGAINANIEREQGIRRDALRDRDSHITAAEARERRAEELRQQAEELRRQASAEEQGAKLRREQALEIDNAQASLEPLPNPVDVSSIRAELDTAKQINAGMRLRDRQKEHLANAAEAERSADALTVAMEARTKQKEEIIAKADFPVPGLGLGDGQVLFNDVPFDQASGAEKLRVGVAIAMALNPKLRVIRITDGSLLDSDAMKILADMAELHDFQVWIESVDSSGKIGIVIEDGMVKGAEAPEQDAA